MSPPPFSFNSLPLLLLLSALTVVVHRVTFCKIYREESLTLLYYSSPNGAISICLPTKAVRLTGGLVATPN